MDIEVWGLPITVSYDHRANGKLNLFVRKSKDSMLQTILVKESTFSVPQINIFK